jgi:GTP-dependent phosphoenolpyruvate carboxykinase
LQALLSADPALWQKEIADVRNYLETYGKRLPAQMLQQLEETEQRLAD